MACVYVLSDPAENLCKIGKSVDVEARSKQLATGNPHPLVECARIETDHPFAVEAHVKRLVRAKRSRRSKAREFYEIEPSELEKLIRGVAAQIAEQHTVIAEAKGLAGRESDGIMLHPGHAERAKHQRLLEVREALAPLEFERDRLTAELKVAIGRASGLEGIATWNSYVKHDLDRDALRKDHRELYESYLRPTTQRKWDLL